jgi:hypothetical protein
MEKIEVWTTYTGTVSYFEINEDKITEWSSAIETSTQIDFLDQGIAEGWATLIEK